MKAPLEGWLDSCSCSYGKGSVGAHIVRPCQFSGNASPCGRAMLAPTAAIRLHVGGGVPDAPMGTRALRADMESAPTSAESFGPGGGKRKPQINQLSATATRYL